MEYTTLSKEEKQIVIDLAKEFGYGHPKYTNFDEIDYKLFEDGDTEEIIYYFAKKLAKANLINQALNQKILTFGA